LLAIFLQFDIFSSTLLLGRNWTSRLRFKRGWTEEEGWKEKRKQLNCTRRVLV